MAETEKRILCETCLRYGTDCPLSGMSSSNSDEPLEGHMISCVSYQGEDAEGARS